MSAIVALLGGAAIWIGFGAQVIGPIMVLLLVVLPLFGILITIDDDLPNGLRGLWGRWENWADLAIRASLCGIGLAIDAGWRSPAATLPWIFGIGALAVLVMFGGRIYGGATRSNSHEK